MGQDEYNVIMRVRIAEKILELKEEQISLHKEKTELLAEMKWIENRLSENEKEITKLSRPDAPSKLRGDLVWKKV